MISPFRARRHLTRPFSKKSLKAFCDICFDFQRFQFVTQKAENQRYVLRVYESSKSWFKNLGIAKKVKKGRSPRHRGHRSLSGPGLAAEWSGSWTSVRPSCFVRTAFASCSSRTGSLQFLRFAEVKPQKCNANLPRDVGSVCVEPRNSASSPHYTSLHMTY